MRKSIKCPHCDFIEPLWEYKIADEIVGAETHNYEAPAWHEILCDNCKKRFNVKRVTAYEIAEE